MVGIIIFLFLLGISIGSFLNVIVFRTIYGTSPLKGRSYCDHCKKPIPWYQNIPILSFILLRGRCSACHKRIPIQYPIVELLTGLLFVWWYFIGQGFFLLATQPWSLVQPVFWLGIGIILLLIFAFDLFYGVIPDLVSYAFFAWVVLYRLGLYLTNIFQPQDLFNSIIAAIVLTAFFYFLYFITKKKGFGLGDVKIAPSLALLLGWPDLIVAVFSAFTIGAVFGLILISLRKKQFGQTLPFAPFLVIGVVIALLWGNQLINQYLSLL